jgi:hypothetical protein
VDEIMERKKRSIKDKVKWKWRDERGMWNKYRKIEYTIIEDENKYGEDEIRMYNKGSKYNVDFNYMKKINEDNGKKRNVKRRMKKR